VESLTDLLLTGTDLESWSFVLLCGGSFLGAFITVAQGLGGGILVLATMALVLTPTVLIPVHGVVQLGSNMGRFVLLARHSFFEILPAFLIGTLLGAVIGGHLVFAYAEKKVFGADPDNSIFRLSWDLCASADLATTSKIA